MSRIGPSLRPALLGSSDTATATAPDSGGPPIPMVAAAAVTLALDAVMSVAAPLLAGSLAASAPAPDLSGRIAALLALFTLGFAASGGAYAASALFRRRQAMLAVRAGLGAGVLVAACVALLREPDALPGGWMLATAALLLGGLGLGRLAFAEAFSGVLARRFGQRTVIIGSGLGGARLFNLLRQLQGQPVRLLGVVDDANATDGELVGGVPYLGPVSQALTLARRGAVDQIVLALPWAEEARILDLVDLLSDFPVHVRLAPDLISYRFPSRARLDAHGHAVLHVAERPISGWASVIKRAEDLLIGGVALALCAVPMAVIALLIRLDSPGPVLFRQRRTGFNNCDFEMLKFRTMHHHMAEFSIRRQASRNDPRVTRVGAILRRTSLDELPQIFNVLRGEMSIVGPRPHAPGTRAGSRPFEQVVERYAARHRVKPGLTGLAQVRGYRGETRTEDILVKRVEADLEYIDSWSLWLDLLIVLRTAIIVTRMQNAY